MKLLQRTLKSTVMHEKKNTIDDGVGEIQPRRILQTRSLECWVNHVRVGE